MVSQYPANIDNNITLPLAIDNGTPVSSTIINNLRNTIINVEQTLGINPGGSYQTVLARFIALEAVIDNTQVISLAGDLGGTVLSPLVIGIQGNPVSGNTPSIGQVLTWNGIWIPLFPPLNGDVTGTTNASVVVALQGKAISAVTPTVNQVLEWNGSAWTPTNQVSNVVFAGDLSGTSTTQEVTGLLDHSLPSLSDGYLNWTGTAWKLSPVISGNTFIASGDLSGTSTNQTVTNIQGVPIIGAPPGITFTSPNALTTPFNSCVDDTPAIQALMNANALAGSINLVNPVLKTALYLDPWSVRQNGIVLYGTCRYLLNAAELDFAGPYGYGASLTGAGAGGQLDPGNFITIQSPMATVIGYNSSGNSGAQEPLQQSTNSYIDGYVHNLYFLLTSTVVPSTLIGQSFTISSVGSGSASVIGTYTLIACPMNQNVQQLWIIWEGNPLSLPSGDASSCHWSVGSSNGTDGSFGIFGTPVQCLLVENLSNVSLANAWKQWMSLNNCNNSYLNNNLHRMMGAKSTSAAYICANLPITYFNLTLPDYGVGGSSGHGMISTYQATPAIRIKGSSTIKNICIPDSAAPCFVMDGAVGVTAYTSIYNCSATGIGPFPNSYCPLIVDGVFEFFVEKFFSINNNGTNSNANILLTSTNANQGQYTGIGRLQDLELAGCGILLIPHNDFSVTALSFTNVILDPPLAYPGSQAAIVYVFPGFIGVSDISMNDCSVADEFGFLMESTFVGNYGTVSLLQFTAPSISSFIGVIGPVLQSMNPDMNIDNLGFNGRVPYWSGRTGGVSNNIETGRQDNFSPIMTLSHQITLPALLTLANWNGLTTTGCTFSNNGIDGYGLIGPDLSTGKMIRITSPTGNETVTIASATVTPHVGDTCFVFMRVQTNSVSQTIYTIGHCALAWNNGTTWNGNGSSGISLNIFGTPPLVEGGQVGNVWVDVSAYATVGSTPGGIATFTLNLGSKVIGADIIVDPESISVVYIPVSQIGVETINSDEKLRLFRKINSQITGATPGDVAIPSRTGLSFGGKTRISASDGYLAISSLAGQGPGFVAVSNSGALSWSVGSSLPIEITYFGKNGTIEESPYFPGCIDDTPGIQAIINAHGGTPALQSTTSSLTLILVNPCLQTPIDFSPLAGSNAVIKISGLLRYAVGVAELDLPCAITIDGSLGSYGLGTATYGNLYQSNQAQIQGINSPYNAQQYNPTMSSATASVGADGYYHLRYTLSLNGNGNIPYGSPLVPITSIGHTLTVSTATINPGAYWAGATFKLIATYVNFAGDNMVELVWLGSGFNSPGSDTTTAGGISWSIDGYSGTNGLQINNFGFNPDVSGGCIILHVTGLAGVDAFAHKRWLALTGCAQPRLNNKLHRIIGSDGTGTGVYIMAQAMALVPSPVTVPDANNGAITSYHTRPAIRANGASITIQNLCLHQIPGPGICYDGMEGFNEYGFATNITYSPGSDLRSGIPIIIDGMILITIEKFFFSLGNDAVQAAIFATTTSAALGAGLCIIREGQIQGSTCLVIYNEYNGIGTSGDFIIENVFGEGDSIYPGYSWGAFVIFDGIGLEAQFDEPVGYMRVEDCAISDNNGTYYIYESAYVVSGNLGVKLIANNSVGGFTNGTNGANLLANDSYPTGFAYDTLTLGSLAGQGPGFVAVSNSGALSWSVGSSLPIEIIYYGLNAVAASFPDSIIDDAPFINTIITNWVSGHPTQGIVLILSNVALLTPINFNPLQGSGSLIKIAGELRFYIGNAEIDLPAGVILDGSLGATGQAANDSFYNNNCAVIRGLNQFNSPQYNPVHISTTASVGADGYYHNFYAIQLATGVTPYGSPVVPDGYIGQTFTISSTANGGSFWNTTYQLIASFNSSTGSSIVYLAWLGAPSVNIPGIQDDGVITGIHWSISSFSGTVGATVNNSQASNASSAGALIIKVTGLDNVGTDAHKRWLSLTPCSQSALNTKLHRIVGSDGTGTGVYIIGQLLHAKGVTLPDGNNGTIGGYHTAPSIRCNGANCRIQNLTLLTAGPGICFDGTENFTEYGYLTNCAIGCVSGAHSNVPVIVDAMILVYITDFYFAAGLGDPPVMQAEILFTCSLTPAGITVGLCRVERGQFIGGFGIVICNEYFGNLAPNNFIFSDIILEGNTNYSDQSWFAFVTLDGVNMSNFFTDNQYTFDTIEISDNSGVTYLLESVLGGANLNFTSVYNTINGFSAICGPLLSFDGTNINSFGNGGLQIENLAGQGNALVGVNNNGALLIVQSPIQQASITTNVTSAVNLFEIPILNYSSMQLNCNWLAFQTDGYADGYVSSGTFAIQGYNNNGSLTLSSVNTIDNINCGVGGAAGSTPITTSSRGNNAIIRVNAQGNALTTWNAGYSTVFINSPTLAFVTPNFGSASGGWAITITGNNFTPGSTVYIGQNPCTSVIVIGTTVITCTTPAYLSTNGSATPQIVTVVTSNGTIISNNNQNNYFYLPSNNTIVMAHTAAGMGVSSWTDQSPAGNNWAQATGGDQPTLGSNFNGTSLPYLIFNGSSQFMTNTFTSPITSGQATIFVVGTVTSGSSYFGAGGVLLSLNTATPNQSSLYIQGYATITPIHFYVGDFAGGIASSAPTDTIPHIFSGQKNGASSFIQVDGINNTGNLTNPLTSLNYTNALGAFFLNASQASDLGTSTGANFWSPCNIACDVVYSGNISTTDIATVTSILKQIYNM